MKSIIRNFIAKRVAGRSDDGIMITLTDPKKVDFQAAMMEDLLMRNGIDPNAIQSEEQLKMILNRISSMKNQTTSGIRNTESAKVFDLKGKRIKDTDNIMGGEEMPPPGSRGGPDDIAAPVQSAEETLKNMTEAEIKANLEAQNRSAVEKILKRKNREDVYGLDDYDTTNMSEIKKEIIRTETKLGNLNPDDPNFRAKAKPLVDKIETLKNKMRDDKADGGRIGFKGGLSKILKEFMERRKFLKTMVGNTEKNRKAMELEMLKETIENARKNPGFEFPSGQELRTEIEKKISPILLKDRKLNADGGIMRVGLKDGMNRRTFLKFLAGAASIPIIGKVFKPFKVGKTVTKVPIIKTDNVPGKPEWFDQLVNKVILEGDDVTKRFATAERQSIHQKTLDDGSVVRVTEDVDDGAVRVEYESPENVYEDVVQMQYKKPLPDEGDPKPMAEFTTAESGPVGRADGPDDYSIDIDEVGGTSISDLTSDVSKLKAYATGEKPTLKEFIQSKKRKDKARRITEGGEAEMDAVIERQGEFIENDLVDLDPPDYASGGIARMLGE